MPTHSDVLDSRMAKFVLSKFGPMYTGDFTYPWRNQILKAHERALAARKVSIQTIGSKQVVGLPIQTLTQQWEIVQANISPKLSTWGKALTTATPWLPGEASFSLLSFLRCLWENSFVSRSAFGKPLAFEKVVSLISCIPAIAPLPPQTELDYPIDHDIILGDHNLAVPTCSGWRFQAGQTYKANFKLWQRVSQNNPTVVSTLLEGWAAPTYCTIKPTWFDSIPLSSQEQEAWDKEVISLWQMGAVQPVDWKWVSAHGLPLVVIPVFLVDEVTKFRPILDARYANLVFNPEWFSLPKVWDFICMLSKDQYFFKTDQKAGWQHVPLHPTHSRFFSFVWRNQLFVYSTPAFGDATAPWVFTYLGATLKRMLRSRKVQFILYIDDLCVVGHTDYNKTCELRNSVLGVCKQLGLVMGVNKCELPAKEGVVLGFHVNTSRGVVSLAHKREQKILTLLNTCDLTPLQPAKVVAKLTGLVISASLLHPQTMWFVAPLLTSLMGVFTKRDWQQVSIQLELPAICRVKQWLVLVHKYPRRLWINPDTCFWVSSDATMDQVGACLFDGPPTYHAGASQQVVKDTAQSRTLLPNPVCIAHKEAAAIPWALSLFQHHIPEGSTVYFAVDNTTAMTVCKKGYSRVQYLMEQINLFMKLAIAKGWVLLFHYVPTKLNCISDSLSRELDSSSDWKLSKYYVDQFLSYCRQYGFPQPFIDCFAANHNKIFPLYHSLHKDVGSRGNFMCATLSPEEVYWANPPFRHLNSLVPGIVKMFREYKTVGWVLLPLRSGAPWWPITSQASRVYTPSISPLHPVFIPPLYTPAYIPCPSFEFSIFCFDFR